MSESPTAGVIHPASVILSNGSDIEPIPIEWLWPGRFALGKVSLIAGDPGGGKSQLTLDMAARITRGTLWPVDNVPAPIGSVVIISAEDDAADTIIPRLIAAGADLSKIHLFDAVREPCLAGTTDRSLSLARDLELLEAAIPADCVVIILDPISAYLGGMDGNNNAELRDLLAPLAKLAQRRRLAVVAISHLNKMEKSRSAYRVTGSIAFTAAARAVYIVAKDQNDSKRRLFLPLKNNLGNDEGGLAYRIVTTAAGVPYLEWDPDAVIMPTDDALSPDDGQRSGREEAQEFLKNLLGNGMLESKVIEKEAESAGITRKCLRTAREHLGIKPQKLDFLGPWFWELPAKLPILPLDAHYIKQGILGNLGESGHLGAGTKMPNIVEDAQSPKMPTIFEDAQDAQKVVGAPRGTLVGILCPDCLGKGCASCRVQITL